MIQDYFVVFNLEVFEVYFGEPIKERFGQGFAAAGLARALTWVLTGKDEEVWVADKLLVEFGNVDGASVVQDSVESF
jgi:hypothetical protein